MTIRTRRPGVSRLLAATGLTLSAVLPGLPAQAQDAGDPPWRVGRLARIDGSVSTHGAGATDWVAATINIPLSSGDAIWTQPGAGAAMQLADNGLVLGEATELDLATLDDHQFVATEPQGELFLDLRSVPSGDSYSITTPRGVVMLAGAGQYGIAAGDSANPTGISVISGAAQIVSGSFSLAVRAGQTASVTGSDALQGTVGGLVLDAFLSAQRARPAAPPAGPPAVRSMTGSESLAQYGSWQQAPEYGQVWYPQVAADWAPYREGSWSYVQPWGWTWVDDEPWGFAPFHYGRWAQFGGRWGWVPGEPGAPAYVYDRPAYAPALVDFFAAGAVAGAVAGAIGWIPLGPHERYMPGFRTNPGYVQRVNYGRTVNTTATIDTFSNRTALTVVPAAAMARSQPVHGIARTGTGALGAAGSGGERQYQRVHGALPVRPGVETRGLTPAAAHGLGLGSLPARASAPGPAVNPVLFRPRELPQSRAPFRGSAGRPAGNRASAAPAAMHGTEPGPQTPPARPGLPGLRAPGAAPPNFVAGHPGAPGPHPGPAEVPHPAPPPARPGMNRPPMTPPQAPSRPSEVRPAPRSEPMHQAPPRPQPQRAPPRAASPAPHPQMARPPEPRPQAPRFQAPRPPAPRPPAPHPTPRPVAPPPHHEEHPGH